MQVEVEDPHTLESASCVLHLSVYCIKSVVRVKIKTRYLIHVQTL